MKAKSLRLLPPSPFFACDVLTGSTNLVGVCGVRATTCGSRMTGIAVGYSVNLA